MQLGHAQLSKRPNERLDALPSSDGMDFRLPKRQPKHCLLYTSDAADE